MAALSEFQKKQTARKIERTSVERDHFKRALERIANDADKTAAELRALALGAL